MIRTILVALLASQLAAPALAQEASPPPDYQRDPDSGCLIWNPYRDQVARWSGACKDGYADGAGTTRWFIDGKLNSTNSNVLVRGRPHGPAKFNRANGDFIEFTFDNGTIHGPALFRYADGATYRGGYVQDRRQGLWTMQWPQGRREEDWQNGALQGVRVSWTNGATYTGGWSQGRAHGNGTYRAADGQVFAGQWSNGCFKQGGRWATVGASKQECGY